MKTPIPIIVVVGPTASGKTALGAVLAKRLGGEVVSADSMQIYKGMDIASAMPTQQEMLGVPHHMLKFLQQGERYSVAAYCEAARKCIEKIVASGKLPVLVGGTGLYIDSLIDNIEYTQGETDLTIRKSLEERLEQHGIAALVEELRSVDPESAARLHENDKKRIIRALEFYYQYGTTITQQAAESRLNASPYKPLFIGLRAADRAYLYERINRRVDIMAENGLLQEAEACLKAAGGTAAQAIGHKELLPYFKGELTLEQALEHLKQQTRRYAKRQLTWFGRNERINWFEIDCFESIEQLFDEAEQLCINFLKEES